MIADELIDEEDHPDPERGNLRENAEKWMADHPEVMDLFEKFANELGGSGRDFGIGLLAERVRWECFFKYGEDEKYKINNNYRAYIARELIRRNPWLSYHMRFRRTRY